MALLKYSRFGTNRHAIRSNTASPLTDEQLRLAIPSLFAAEKHESRSERFTYVPTIDVLTKLRAEGFEPFSACQTRSRDDGQLAFTKHMLRLRRVDFSQSRDEVPEVIVLNSHNGSSSYQMMAGIFRFVCANGLISADESTQEIRVRHKGDIVGEVIEGAYRVVQDFETVQASIEKMKAVKLLPEELHMFAASALALRWPNGAAPIDTVRVSQARRPSDTGMDLWTTFNRVQENLLRGGQVGARVNGRSARTRAVSGIGQNVALNRGLWMLAAKRAGII